MTNVVIVTNIAMDIGVHVVLPYTDFKFKCTKSGVEEQSVVEHLPNSERSLVWSFAPPRI